MTKKERANVGRALAAIIGIAGTLDVLRSRRMVTEDKKRSKKCFPKGGLNLIAKEVQDAHRELTEAFIQDDARRRRPGT